MSRNRFKGLARLWRGTLFTAGLACLAGAGLARAADDFLDPDQAFVLHAERSADGALALHWKIAAGYALYRDRLHLRADGAELAVAWPAADRKTDPGSGEVMAVYHGRLDVSSPALKAGQLVDVEYQGCADGGLCYSPQHRFVRLDAAVAGPALTLLPGLPDSPGLAAPAGAQASVQRAAATPTVAAGIPDSGADDSGQRAGQVLRSGSLLEVVGTFFLFGVLLSLTPCVLPMIKGNWPGAVCAEASPCSTNANNGSTILIVRTGILMRAGAMKGVEL